MLSRWFKQDKKRVGGKDILMPPDIPGLMAVKPVDSLLSLHTGRITQINELAGLSASNFDLFYLSAIKNYARFVQLLPASEVHHHASSGGMLTHALEVCVIALKIRRSYLLSDSGEAEEISKNQDLWTYAIFIAALCHDVAKVVVDQQITVYDNYHRLKKWDPWAVFIDEQGRWYSSEFVSDRQYKLHEKAAPFLVNRIISSQGMRWIGSDLFILSKWVACLSGDIDNASSIGEIVSLADGKSVASNLGADNSRMTRVKTKPLHEKMLTALRYLLMEGELPLNRNGAAGWVIGDDCWLVSKRTVDAIRDQLTQEGHSGVPSKNGRLFDVLQEHGVIIPYGEKAIWPCVIEGDGWRNNLTLIKVDVKKIWANPKKRPSNFEGRIILADDKNNIPTNASQVNKSISTEPEHKERDLDGSQVRPVITPDFSSADEEDALKKVPYNVLEPLEQAVSNTIEDEDDLLAFLPTDNLDMNSERSTLEAVTEKTQTEEKSLEIEIKPADTINPVAKIAPAVCLTESEFQVSLPVAADNSPNQESVGLFFSWLQEGVQSGRQKINQAKARIHQVEEGVIIITPGIFQDYAKTAVGENIKWTTIQQKVLKKNWHVRDEKGLNVVKYQVKGQSRQTTVNAILFKDVSKVFGQHSLPGSNPHLIKVD